MASAFPLPDRRMKDARDLPQLQQMLDDYFFKLTSLLIFKYPKSFNPTVATCNGGLQVGTLVQAQVNNTLARCSRESPYVSMSGVVIDVLGNNNYVFSTMAQLDLAIPDATGQTNQPLYLGNNGVPQVTAPVTGLYQNVGLVINFNAQTKLYTCLLTPGPSAVLD